MWKSDTKEIKKKHSPRQVGGAEAGPGQRGLMAKWRLADPARWRIVEQGQARLHLADPTMWWLADPVAPHSHINRLGGTAGERSRPRNPRAPAWGNKASNL